MLEIGFSDRSADRGIRGPIRPGVNRARSLSRTTSAKGGTAAERGIRSLLAPSLADDSSAKAQIAEGFLPGPCSHGCWRLEEFFAAPELLASPILPSSARIREDEFNNFFARVGKFLAVGSSWLRQWGGETVPLRAIGAEGLFLRGPQKSPSLPGAANIQGSASASSTRRKVKSGLEFREVMLRAESRTNNPHSDFFGVEPKKVPFSPPKKPKNSPERGGTRSPSVPIPPVERAVIDGFAEMDGGDFFAVVEVGDRAADAEDFVVGAGRQAEFVHGGFQEGLGVPVGRQCLRISAGSSFR